MTRSPPSPARCRYCCSLRNFAALALFGLTFAAQQCSGAEYYGKLIGKLSQLHHGVSGEVYAVDARTLFLKDFTYDGEGPAAYFYVGNSKTVGQNGYKIRDERGMLTNLKRYRKKDITLSLPEGKTLNNAKWFSVYCDEYAENFGDVKIPRSFDFPRPQKLTALSGIHGVSSEPVVLVDAQTLLIPSFSYDGEAPDAKFWAGSGPSPSPQGIRIPDENGKEVPLRRYDRKTIVLTLPGDITVHQLGHFGVWCEAFAVDFGHVQIPQNVNVPPSLKMLGVSPQSKLNCEVLDENLTFEVRWAVAGDSIVVQLVGKLDNGQYMSFGLSADPQKSVMVGGDVVVAWVDKQTLQGYAVDYFLESKSQCSGGRGSCPDLRIQDNSSSVRLLNAAMVNSYSIVTYQRPLKAEDGLDLPITTNSSQAIIWAIGPLNDKNEVSFHTSFYLKGDRSIDFGRPPAWNCPTTEEFNRHQQEQETQKQQQENQAQQQQYQERQQRQQYHEQQQQAPPLQHRQQGDGHRRGKHTDDKIEITTRRPSRIPATPAPAPQDDAWEIPPIQCYEPEDGVFYAQMGPTGGSHGYPAITGHVGWGISWYINGLLIPEIHVVRGKTYTFVVEGGDNPEIPARYHPFYITNDPVGGYQHKTPEERANITIFAGVRRQRGVVRPTGVGRLCNWKPDQNEPLADEFSSFGAYQRTLTLECDQGEPGVVTWVPDEKTPDTVYYQCFTHRYLGWKIHVHDTCDTPKPEASELHEVLVAPDQQQQQTGDLEGEASIIASPSKVTPSPEFFQQHQEYASRDLEYLRNRQAHHHPQLLHHHAKSAINNKLITGPYLRDHHLLPKHHHHYTHNNYRFPPQLTHLMPVYALQKVTERAEDHHHRRFPAKQLARETYVNYFIQSDNNNNKHSYNQPPLDRHQHYNHHHGPGSLSQGVQESVNNIAEIKTFNTTMLDPDSQNSQIIPDRQVARQPPAFLINRAVNPPMHVPYSVPTMHLPTATSVENVVYVKEPMSNGRNQPVHEPLPAPQIMIVQRRPQVPAGPYYQMAPKRHPSIIPLLGAAYNPQQVPVASVMSAPKQPVLYERKKEVHKRPMLSRMQIVSKPSNPQRNHQPTKLMKIEVKQQPIAKVEVKNTQTEESSALLKSMLLKPARNTGFDPKTIVIEKGFKPIIMKKNVDNENTTNSERSSEMQQDEAAKKITSERYNENLEPVFIPSPPDRHGIKKQYKKKTQLSRMKSKLNFVDDMEMAADNREKQDYVHLHFPVLTTASSTNKRSPKSSSLFDLVTESSNSSAELQRPERASSNNSSSNTELLRHAPMKRVRRNSQKQSKGESWDITRYRDEGADGHQHDYGSSHDHDNHSHKEHDHLNKNDRMKESESLQQSSTGEIIMANIQYILLTIVFYYIL